MKNIAFFIILTVIGYHALKRQTERQQVSQKVAEEYQPTKLLLEETKPTIHLQTPQETPVSAQNTTNAGLAVLLKEDPEIQAVADIFAVSCEAARCQLAVESKIENISRFKRAFLTFLRHHPEHGPYWKFVPSEDYERSMRIIFSDKPI